MKTFEDIREIYAESYPQLRSLWNPMRFAAAALQLSMPEGINPRDTDELADMNKGYKITQLESGFWCVWYNGEWVEASLPSRRAAEEYIKNPAKYNRQRMRARYLQ